MKDLYEKTALAPLVAGVGLRALAGGAARAVGTGLWHGARALAGSPAAGTLTGAARVGSNIGTGLNAANSAVSMGSMAKDLIPRPPPPPTPNSANTQASGLSPKLGSALERRFAKLAFGVSNAANIASYLSLIGAELTPHENPWHNRLEAAGLGGLAASTAGSMIANPAERDPGVQELAGLALFGNALRTRSMKHASEKTAGVGATLGATLGGLGAGIGAVHGFYTDDPTESFDHHVMRALRHGGIGLSVGGVAGGTVGGLLGLTRAGKAIAAGPFPHTEGSAEHTLPRLLDRMATKDPSASRDLWERGLQGAYKTYVHPVTRLGLGTAVGYHGAKAVQEFYDDVNLQQYAAQQARHHNPDQPNAAELGASVARRHMGDFRSSLDKEGSAKHAAEVSPLADPTPVLSSLGRKGMGGSLSGPTMAQDWATYRHGMRNHATASDEEMLRAELADGRLANRLWQGSTTALGAIGGAALGRAIAGPKHELLGTLAGGAVGGLGMGGLASLAAPYVARSPYEGLTHEEALRRIRAVREQVPGSKEGSAKHAFTGPLTELSMAGLPSALGYVYGSQDPGQFTPREAQAQLNHPMNPLGLAFVPGYTGYHYGRRAAAQKLLERLAHGETPAPRTPYASPPSPYASP